MSNADDNRTAELREKLTERGIEWKDGDASYETEWSTPDGRHCSAMYWKPTFTVLISGCTPEQAIAATLGSERDEIYNAGFDNGVKACLQILDGYLDYPHSAVENISKWVDEQWKELES